MSGPTLQHICPCMKPAALWLAAWDTNFAPCLASKAVTMSMCRSCCCLYCRFDPNSTKFTLESVVSLRLDQHVDFIAELSVTASKEQAIETSLANIASTWAELQLDMAEYKGTYKLRSTEDIFTALEDNGVTLSTMKASKYYLVFEEQVAHWERTLALASETVEIILQVGVAAAHRPYAAIITVRSTDHNPSTGGVRSAAAPVACRTGVK